MGSSAISYNLARRAEELLGDGEWHNYEQVLRALSRLVPPGRAMRENEKTRKSKQGRKDGYAPAPEHRKIERPTEELIAAGARTIVADFLRNRAFEHSGRSKVWHDPDRQIRMVAKHRALTGDPYRVQRDQLQIQLTAAQDQLDRLRKFVKDLGITIPEDLMGDPGG